MPRPVRLRDFIEDEDGWLYAVSTYDNDERIGCVLRYVPDEQGERVNAEGRHYTKYDFEEAYDLISRRKPQYAGLLHHVPHGDVKRVLKPDHEIGRIAAAHPGSAETRQPLLATGGYCRVHRLTPLRSREREFGHRSGRGREALVRGAGPGPGGNPERQNQKTLRTDVEEGGPETQTRD